MIVGLVLLVLAVALVAWAVRRWARPSAASGSTAGRRAERRPHDPPPGGGWSRDGERVRIDVEVPGEPGEALVRLAVSVATEVLASDPSLDAVTVVDRVGRGITTLPRPTTPSRPPHTLDTVRLAREATPHVPSPVRPPSDDAPPPGVTTPPPSTARRTLLDRLTVTDAVRAACTEPDRPAAIVATLLRLAGRPAEVDGDLVVSGDRAVAIADVRDDPETALSRAFLRLDASPASQGLIIVLGFVDPAVVRGRDGLTPTVRYADVDALQRMADAVTLGLDPLALAATPRA
jgi:hypothetical protein